MRARSLATLLLLAACDMGGKGSTTRLTSDGTGSGLRVAIDGVTALVSSGTDGPVALYERGADGWSRAADLRPEGGLPGNESRYGLAVAVDGSVAVVGAPGAGGNRGAVFVFERASGVGGRWSATARLQPPDVQADGPPDGRNGSAFGSAVAVSKDRIFVGRPGDDALDVYSRGADGWTRAGTVPLPEPDRARAFGRYVATDGVSVVVSAFQLPPDPARPLANGVAYVFRPGSGPAGYALDGRLASDLRYDDFDFPQEGLYRGDGLGAVDVDGDVVVAGAPGVGVGEQSDAGAVLVFERGDSGWVRSSVLIPAGADRDDYIGHIAVAVEGGTVVAASDKKRSRGVVYTFERTTSGWVEADALAEHATPANQAFGLSLALSDGTLLVGAPYEDGERGAAYVYRRSGRGWTR